MSELCSIYYEPVRVFVAQWTAGREGADDLVHAFFEDVLRRESFGPAADPARGRFRSYLLGAVKHFLLKQRGREQAAKRGGGIEPGTLDEAAAGEWRESAAELAFDRDWALALIRRAVENLAQESSAANKLRQFESLKPWLDGGSPGSVEEVAKELGMTANAVHVAIHRLRQRFLKLVRFEVESTTASPADAAEEFRHLVNVLVVAG
ncbi:RNA polymerase subunit sigma-24 [Luteolibacter sp. LG18]|nr:RNA polymerase subunit sigma-24 [Luteolibacter sp. LG18]